MKLPCNHIFFHIYQMHLKNLLFFNWMFFTFNIRLLLDFAIIRMGLNSCTLKPKPCKSTKVFEKSIKFIMQSMKERLKWKNNNGSTSKAFGKLKTTNYVVKKTLVDESNNEHVAQHAWFTPFNKDFDSFGNPNTLEIPTISRFEWKNFQWNFQQLWPRDKIVRKHKLS
jgi:hypothetical protein